MVLKSSLQRTLSPTYRLSFRSQEAVFFDVTFSWRMSLVRMARSGLLVTGLRARTCTSKRRTSLFSTSVETDTPEPSEATRQPAPLVETLHTPGVVRLGDLVQRCVGPHTESTRL